jgi:hypothetical protein
VTGEGVQTVTPPFEGIFGSVATYHKDAFAEFAKHVKF